LLPDVNSRHNPATFCNAWSEAKARWLKEVAIDKNAIVVEQPRETPEQIPVTRPEARGET